MDSLVGQTYLVTGASKGIGLAICLELAKQHARVVLLARPSAALDQAEALIQTHAPLSFQVACDMSESDSIQAAVQRVCGKVERIDGLVHNAGDIEPIKPMLAISDAVWNRSLMVNLMGVQQLTKGLSSLFEGTHRVRVTTISSGAAVRPISSWSAYCTAKAGLDMWTRCLAVEGADMNISAVSVAPGIVDTDMQATIRSSSAEDFPLVQSFVGYHQDGQLAPADEVAKKLLPLITAQTMEDSGKRFDVRDL